MQQVNELLEFNFSSAILKQAASVCFNSPLLRAQDAKIHKLEKITQKLGASEWDFGDSNLTATVFKKFKNWQKGDKSKIVFERKELRTLTFSLNYSEPRQKSIFNSQEELMSLFGLLDNSWRPYFLKGLVYSYLKLWDSENKASQDVLYSYLGYKLKEYKGERAIYIALKNNLKYYSSNNGDVILGNELAIKKTSVLDATEHLGVPLEWFTYPYFSKVIVAYFEKRRRDLSLIMDDLTDALFKHNNSTTNKKVVSKLIILANSKEFAELQDQIKNIAFKYVGDPGNTICWNPFTNATEAETQELTKAREILNEWITRQCLTVFFEKCINDVNRKSFWLKYAKEITRIKVVGSDSTKRILLYDKRISEFVSYIFSKTTSTSDSNSALMFIMKNYLFVEFSDTGAFYAYKLSNPMAPSIDQSNFHTTSQLKITSMPQIIYRTGNTVNNIHDEGRLGHQQNWEGVAKYWIKEKCSWKVQMQNFWQLGMQRKWQQGMHSL